MLIFAPREVPGISSATIIQTLDVKSFCRLTFQYELDYYTLISVGSGYFKGIYSERTISNGPRPIRILSLKLLTATINLSFNMSQFSVNLVVKHDLIGEPVLRNNETYMHLKAYRVKFIPQRVFLHFTNLFNGDKRLGDQMNR